MYVRYGILSYLRSSFAFWVIAHFDARIFQQIRYIVSCRYVSPLPLTMILLQYVRLLIRTVYYRGLRSRRGEIQR